MDQTDRELRAQGEIWACTDIEQVRVYLHDPSDFVRATVACWFAEPGFEDEGVPMPDDVAATLLEVPRGDAAGDAAARTTDVALLVATVLDPRVDDWTAGIAAARLCRLDALDALLATGRTVPLSAASAIALNVADPDLVDAVVAGREFDAALSTDAELTPQVVRDMAWPPAGYQPAPPTGYDPDAPGRGGLERFFPDHLDPVTYRTTLPLADYQRHGDYLAGAPTVADAAFRTLPRARALLVRGGLDDARLDQIAAIVRHAHQHTRAWWFSYSPEWSHYTDPAWAVELDRLRTLARTHLPSAADAVFLAALDDPSRVPRPLPLPRS